MSEGISKAIRTNRPGTSSPSISTSIMAVPIYGFYLEGNQAFLPVMEDWLKPFHDIGAKIATLQGIGSTDHLSFIAAGLPGFQAIHDYTNYDVRTHHTNMDTFERVDLDALKQASVVMASILYHAAMRDEKIPRKTR